MDEINLSKARRGISNKSAIINDIRPQAISSETRLKLSARYEGIKVKIFDKSKNLVEEFTTIYKAAKYLGLSEITVNSIMNTSISYDNYTYEFEAVIGHPIIVADKKKNSIKEYCSISAAVKDIAVRRQSISNYINTNKSLRGIYLISRA